MKFCTFDDKRNLLRISIVYLKCEQYCGTYPDKQKNGLKTVSPVQSFDYDPQKITVKKYPFGIANEHAEKCTCYCGFAELSCQFYSIDVVLKRLP